MGVLVTAYKRSGVRFSMVEENITFDGEIPIWEEEDWMMAGDEDYEVLLIKTS